MDDSGNVIIADWGNSRIRRLAAGTGVITTVAGNGVGGFGGDGGPGTSASLWHPAGVAVDGGGNVLIADEGNNRIRRLAAGTGVITTVAGNGLSGFSGDGGPATSASLAGPAGVAVDGGGNVLIADYWNHCIRRVTAGTGVITMVVGNGGVAGFSGDGGPGTSATLVWPRGMAVDRGGNVLIADEGNHRIRLLSAGTGVITTVAGNGLDGFSGDGEPGTSASLNSPFGVAVDGGGNVLIADTVNDRIRRLAVGTGVTAMRTSTRSATRTGTRSATRTGTRSATRTRTSPTRTCTPTPPRTPSPTPLAMCAAPVANVTTLTGLSGVAPPVALGVHGTSGLFSSGGCARGLSSIYASARIVYFLNLGTNAALGGRLTISTCDRTAGDTLLYVGTGCPVGPVTFQCLVGNDNAGDVPGQAPCAGNVGASTVTIASTTSRLYFVMLGFFPGTPAPVASVAWAYTPPAPTATGTRSRTRKPKLLRG